MTRKQLLASLALWRKRWRKAKPGTAARSLAYRMVKRRKGQLAPPRPSATSGNGVRFVASWEGFSAVPYNDGAFPKPGHATIGYGTLLHRGPVTEADRRKWGRITEREARYLLSRELREKEAAVERLVKVPLNQAEYDALVSFAYNVGEGGLAGSTLLRKLNAGDRRGAADEFLRWDKAGGQVLRGLTRRRQAERLMFLSGVYREN